MKKIVTFGLAFLFSAFIFQAVGLAEQYNFVEINLVGGPSPYESASYFVRQIDDGSVVLGQSHTCPCDKGVEVRTATIDLASFRLMMEKLIANGAMELEDGEVDSVMAGSYEFSIGWSGKEAGWSVRGPFLLSDGRYAASIRLVEKTIRDHTGTEVYFDNCYKQEETGIATIWTQPWGQVTIDGIPLNRRSPLLSLELSAGLHRLQMVRPDLGIDRFGPLKIRAGKTQDFILTLIKK